jgi:hypothetical protein
MHPTIHYEIAKTRGAELRREAERDRIARSGRTPGRGRAQAAARPVTRRLRRMVPASTPPSSCS